MSFWKKFFGKKSPEPELKEETRCMQGEVQGEILGLTEQGSNLFIALKLIKAIDEGKIKRYQGIDQFLKKFQDEFTGLEEVHDDYDSVELKLTPELKKLQALFVNRSYKCEDTKLLETIMTLS
jgi:hypothetical protein